MRAFAVVVVALTGVTALPALADLPPPAPVEEKKSEAPKPKKNARVLCGCATIIKVLSQVG